MSNSEVLPLLLLVISPLIAKIVSEFFADKPNAWEWTKGAIDLVGLWVCFLGGAEVIAGLIL